MPALAALLLLIGKFRSQQRGSSEINDEEMSLEEALHANRFAARCASRGCFRCMSQESLPSHLAAVGSKRFGLCCSKVYMYTLVAIFEVRPHSLRPRAFLSRPFSHRMGG